MNKTSTAKAANTSQTVSQLLELTKLDTLYRDLYLQRARDLLKTKLSASTYASLKESEAQLPWIEKQLRAAVERGEWENSQKLSEKIRDLREKLTAKREHMNQGEAVYEGLADISIDPFSPGYHVFVGASAETLEELRSQAIGILSSLQKTDETKRDFYARREADFKHLMVKAPAADEDGKSTSSGAPAQLQQQALNALESGDLSQLDGLIKQLMEKGAAQPKTEETSEVKQSDAPELGKDLLCSFSEATLKAAAELGFAPVQTKSRRQFAHLLSYAWQPWFLKTESRQHSKSQLERLTFPSNVTDKNREAIEFYLLNPFVTSSGTRYNVCMVVEDLLIEDFADPESKAETPGTKLLSALRLEKRWSLSRTDVENALVEFGPAILKEQLGLDPEDFCLVAVPPDIFTAIGPERGWGEKEMWTQYDGYRVIEGGKLQALAGGDKRFGGKYDVVSFSPSYSSDKIFVRFAVVQRKRMMSWHQARTA